MDVEGIGGFFPLLMDVLKWALVAVLVLMVIFWQVARRARVRAYGPGGGRK